MIGESPGSVRLEKLLHAAGSIHRSSLINGLINISESCGKIQKIDPAVKPRSKNGYADQSSIRIVQPVDIQAGKFVHNTYCRWSMIWKIIAAELDAIAIGRA